MKLFVCQACGNVLYFENRACERCGHQVAFLSEKETMSAIEPDGDGWTTLADKGKRRMLCSNAEYDACNWLTDAADSTGYCRACRHNGIVPDLSDQAQLAGWRLSVELPGFQKVMELKRRMSESKPVNQMVYSDGLAAVSVFIEPSLREPKGPSLWQQGAVNIYTRQQANHTVTVLGEAPAATLMQIANSLEQKPTTASLQ